MSSGLQKRSSERRPCWRARNSRAIDLSCLDNVNKRSNRRRPALLSQEYRDFYPWNTRSLVPVADHDPIEMETSSQDIASPLLALIKSLSSTAATVEHYFHKLPGSPILIRYIRSSYQVGPPAKPWSASYMVLMLSFAYRMTHGDRCSSCRW